VYPTDAWHGTQAAEWAWLDMLVITPDDENEVVAELYGNGFTCHDDRMIADLIRKGFVADSGNRHNGKVVWMLTPLGKLVVADERTMMRH
jgi:hypothetical protein